MFVGKHSRRAVLLLLLLSIVTGHNASSDVIQATSTLAVTVTSESQVDEGNTVPVIVEITTDNLTDVNLIVEATGGTFGNSTTVNDVLSVNGTLSVSYDWTAPDNLLDFMDVEINASVSADNLTASDVFTIRVLPVTYGFLAEWQVEENVSQDELLDVSLLVRDNVTLDPVVGAEVTFLTDAGTFPSGSDSVTVSTNSSGWGSTVLNFSMTQLLSNVQEVSISATVSKDKYEPLTTIQTVKVRRVQVPGFRAEIDKTSLSRGESATITVWTTINTKPWVNATIEATATGGKFSNGDTLIKSRTDKDGKLEIVWSTEDLPVVREDTVFEITVKVVSADFEIEPVVFNVTVKAESLSLSIDTSQTTAAPLLVTPGLLGLLAVPILRRK